MIFLINLKHIYCLVILIFKCRVCNRLFDVILFLPKKIGYMYIHKGHETANIKKIIFRSIALRDRLIL